MLFYNHNFKIDNELPLELTMKELILHEFTISFYIGVKEINY